MERTATPWKEVYAGWRAALQALALTTTSEHAPTEDATVGPREAAERALNTGDMKGLAKLAGMLMASVAPRSVPASHAPASPSSPAPERSAKDLLRSWTDDALKGARRLGLATRRLESRVELASLRQYAWSPFVPDGQGGSGSSGCPCRPSPLRRSATGTRCS